MKNYTIAQEYTLPSNGDIYDVPFDGNVKLRSMTVQEEMKRSNRGGNANATLCEIIDDCLVTELPLSVYDMAMPDYEFLLHKLRIVTYGKSYKMFIGCPHCGSQQSVTADLSELKVVNVDKDEYQKLLCFKLPVCNKEIKLRIPTPRLEDTIQNKVKEFNKQTPEFKGDMTPVFTLETLIDTVDGNKMSYIELQKLIRNMQLADYNTIIQKIEKLNSCFGLDKRIDFTCNKCGGEVLSFFRITREFFRPTID